VVHHIPTSSATTISIHTTTHSLIARLISRLISLIGKQHLTCNILGQVINVKATVYLTIVSIVMRIDRVWSIASSHHIMLVLDCVQSVVEALLVSVL
jgi:hypothetical protein